MSVDRVLAGWKSAVFWWCKRSLEIGGVFWSLNRVVWLDTVMNGWLVVRDVSSQL